MYCIGFNLDRVYFFLFSLYLTNLTMVEIAAVSIMPPAQDSGIDCPACSEMYTDNGPHCPVVLLDCAHTVCCGCAENKINQKCPLCRKSVTRRPEKNFALLDNLALFRNSRRSRHETVICCGNKCTRHAVNYCHVCDSSFCTQCDDKVHQVFSHGNHIMPVAERPQISWRCEKHTERYNFYCKTCDTQVCNSCSHTTAHKDHDITPVEELVMIKKMQLQQASDCLLCDIDNIGALHNDVLEVLMLLDGKNKADSYTTAMNNIHQLSDKQFV